MPVQILSGNSDEGSVPTVDLSWSGTLPPSQANIQKASVTKEPAENEDGVAPEAVTARDRRQAEMGKFCSGIHNVGLALLRLEALEAEAGPLQVDVGNGEKLFLKAFSTM